MNTDRLYAAQADKEEGRDHDVRNAYAGRIVPSEGAFGRAWVRFNPDVKLVYVDDAEGRPRALTPKQYEVLKLALEMIKGTGMTMREMAQRLEVSPSTVSRALTKLQSFGIIRVIVGRGRWAGLVILRAAQNDGMERFRKAAKERVRRWKEAADKRVSRLWINVAPYIQRGEGNDYVSQWEVSLLTTNKGATLTAQRPWTPEELREAGII